MSLIDKLKHAFAVEPPEEGFTPDEMALLDKVAQAVVKRQMATPAVMFLESVRPLNFLGSQAMVFFQPIVALVISTSEYERFSQILERRKSISLLIELIEKYDSNKHRNNK